MGKFYHYLRLSEKEKNIFKRTEGIMLGKVTNIENKMNTRLSRKQSKKKPRRAGH